MESAAQHAAASQHAAAGGSTAQRKKKGAPDLPVAPSVGLQRRAAVAVVVQPFLMRLVSSVTWL